MEVTVDLQRRRRAIASANWSSETIYAVTDLTWRQARADPDRPGHRGHWRIEAPHWIREVSFKEGLSQIRTGHGPANMATLRNFAVSRHRLAEATNLAKPAGTPPNTPTAPSRCPHNGQINYAEAPRRAAHRGRDVNDVLSERESTRKRRW